MWQDSTLFVVLKGCQVEQADNTKRVQVELNGPQQDQQ